MVWILDFPLPPSVNNYLMPIAAKATFSKKTGRYYTPGRLVKTKEHKDYQTKSLEWVSLIKEKIEGIKERIYFAQLAAENDNIPFALKVDIYFCFEKSRIITINNGVHRLDRDNYIKPLQDQLQHVLGIDDKFVFCGNSEKVTANSKDEECVIIRVAVTRPRTKIQIMDLVKLENSEVTALQIEKQKT